MINGNPSLRTAFECGELEMKGQFMLGSNYTFLVTVRHEQAEFPAVYKPTRGEQPLWDFPENSLAQREVAAYLVSEALGLGCVPFTTLRDDGPLGRGSLQQYIEYDPEYHYFSFSATDRQRLRPTVLFDLLCNNADRKGSHVLIESGTDKLWLIDHGICFHADDKLRTVMWDFAGQAIPDDLLTRLADFVTRLDTDPDLVAALRQQLRPRELAALRARTEGLLRSRLFPRPPADRRATPWPPL